VKSLARCLTFLKESGLKAVAATEKAREEISAADLRGPLVIILGSEEKGISRELLAQADRQVSIPITGTIGSLNVSVSAGILLYEVGRQRGESGSRQ
jgi:23S rRNA (guanosine2251-2'-O)-methyltransferase